MTIFSALICAPSESFVPRKTSRVRDSSPECIVADVDAEHGIPRMRESRVSRRTVTVWILP